MGDYLCKGSGRVKEVGKSSINVNISKVSDIYTWICKNEVHDSLKGNSGEVNHNVIDNGTCKCKDLSKVPLFQND